MARKGCQNGRALALEGNFNFLKFDAQLPCSRLSVSGDYCNLVFAFTPLVVHPRFLSSPLTDKCKNKLYGYICLTNAHISDRTDWLVYNLLVFQVLMNAIMLAWLFFVTSKKLIYFDKSKLIRYEFEMMIMKNINKLWQVSYIYLSNKVHFPYFAASSNPRQSCKSVAHYAFPKQNNSLLNLPIDQSTRAYFLKCFINYVLNLNN